ncbi:MAG: biotin carboxylase N-terminal domain-containing protein [Bdellovibrionota bacterium]
MARIKKLAIANRGEVAVRIIHAAQELGIKTILLHSQVDVGTRAFRMADQTICIGPATTAESYLNIKANVDGALAMGADAVHPGFGFLSENADFAEAVIKAGMIFVGPKPESIRKLGDKVQCKKLAEEAGIPLVPGYKGDDQSVSGLKDQANKMGYPLIIKAAAGGGGRGMKIIYDPKETEYQIQSAQREAMAAFGSSVVFLEKYLDKAKHIEFQIFGDSSGKVVHLFDRECSVQRRHQKIIEEALSPSLPEELRKKMGQVAELIGSLAGYQGAGTVEFMVQNGEFYLLEVNTRLQVEHPVTEMVLGMDLVKAQILTAAGEFVFPNDFVRSPRGHAIECRIYAEDPFKDGIPSTGVLGTVEWPEAYGRRFEYGFEKGDEITSYYDSMIAKVIVWDENRTRALDKMIFTLQNCRIMGVYTNIPLLIEILRHPNFVDGTMTTQFFSKFFGSHLKADPLTDDEKFVLEEAQRMFAKSAFTPDQATGQAPVASPWSGAWSQPGGGGN